MRRLVPLLAAAIALAGCGKAPAPPAHARVVVLGFDGMDPALTERWMDSGDLPHFRELAKSGGYQRLGTTNPPQSPVAWSSFATGLNPGGHGVFDFLARDPRNYSPDFAIAQTIPPQRVLNLFSWRLPLDDGEVKNRRHGEPFWLAAEKRGDRASVLRVPVTYPPDAVTHMLSGMGVPDLLGTQGTYTIYATRPIGGADNGGRVELVQIADDGRIHARFTGPGHPLKPAAPPLDLPLELAPTSAGARLTLGGESADLAPGQWSPWLHLRFRFAGVTGVGGMVRALLLEGFPRPRLYISPINIDPRNPATAISAPAAYASELAERIGDFHTLGMPEETWSLNQGHMSEQAWLDTVETTLAEGEKMLFDALDRRDSELVVEVFVQTDRVSHMFWRGLDPQHPLHAKSSELARGAVAWIYREADRILGETRAKLGPDDKLVVLSDHGFASFRRAVHLNRWLADQGLLVFRAGLDGSHALFADVDWPRTRAYAIGLNGIYLNRKGREAQGIVEDADVDALKQRIAAGLDSLRDGDETVVTHVHDAKEIYAGEYAADAPDLVIGFAPGFRASWQTTLGAAPATLVEDNLQAWSGDHCIDPSAVPGVLFTSFALPAGIHDIRDVGGIVLASLPPTTAPRPQ